MSERYDNGDGGAARVDVGTGAGGADGGSEDIERQVAGFLDEALSSVLDSARRSAADLVERTRQASEDHMSEARRLQEEARSKNARLVDYRSRVESLARDVYRKVEEVRAQVRDIPGRLESALSPLKESLVSIEVVIGDLSDTLRSIQDDQDLDPEPDPGKPRVTVKPFDPTSGSDLWAVAAAGNDPVSAPDGMAEPSFEDSEAAADPAGEPPAEEPSDATVPFDQEQDEPVATSHDLGLVEPQDPAPAPDQEASEDPAAHADPDDPEHWKFLRPADIDWRDLPSAQAS